MTSKNGMQLLTAHVLLICVLISDTLINSKKKPDLDIQFQSVAVCITAEETPS